MRSFLLAHRISVCIVVIALVTSLTAVLVWFQLPNVTEGKNLLIMTRAELITDKWSEIVFVHRYMTAGYGKEAGQGNGPLSALTQGTWVIVESRLQGGKCVIAVNGEKIAEYVLSLGSYCTGVNAAGAVQLIQRITDRATAGFSNITIINIATEDNSHYTLRIETLKLQTLFSIQIPFLTEIVILLMVLILLALLPPLIKNEHDNIRSHITLEKFCPVIAGLIIGLSVGLVVEGLSLLLSDYVAVVTFSSTLTIIESVLIFILLGFLLYATYSNKKVLIALIIMGCISVHCVLLYVLLPIWQIVAFRFYHESSLLHAVGLIALQLIPVPLMIRFSSRSLLDIASSRSTKFLVVSLPVLSFFVYTAGFVFFFALHGLVHIMLLLRLLFIILTLVSFFIVYNTLVAKNITLPAKKTLTAWLLMILCTIIGIIATDFSEFYRNLYVLLFILSPIVLGVVIDFCANTISSWLVRDSDEA